MALAPGTRLGPYEIASALGAGGMGEVYRARDTRLDRTVAIKVLPAQLSSNPTLRQRLDREARAISNLSHPHICTLFDVGHENETDYLVMEYLVGETLADRLMRGPLPQEQVLKMGIELADALENAHRAGLVHRDVKPGNVMLTKSGVKLLDFGLARALDPSPALPSWSAATKTQNKPLTQEGAIVGTYQYMAPEQIEGGQADARTDIFALGALLYEAATGRMAFPGKTQASVVAAILGADPPAMSSLQPLAPARLERLVHTCLAKDPDQRIQSAHDVKVQLEWLQQEAKERSVQRLSARSKLLMALAAMAAVFAVIAAVWLLTGRRPPEQAYGVTRFSITMPAQVELATDATQAVVLSRDGKQLAYVAARSGVTHLFVRPLDGFSSMEIPDSENATFPFFSPDGRWLGFFSHGRLKKAPLNGASPVVICDLPTFYGAVWMADNTLLYSGPGLGVGTVSADGGTPQTIPYADKGTYWPIRPAALPGDDWVMATEQTERNRRTVALRRSTGEMKVLLNNAQGAFYAAGRLVYYSGGAAWAIPFDARSLTVHGEPVQLVSGIDEVNTVGQLAVSENGVLAYAPGSGENFARNILVVGRNGSSRKLDLSPDDYVDLAFAPDGERMALVMRMPGEQQLAVYDLERGVMMRVLANGDRNAAPAWTSDGKQLVFDVVGSGKKVGLYRMPADGSSAPEMLHELNGSAHVTSIAGDTAVLMLNDPKTSTDLWLLSLSSRQMRPFRQTPAMERQGSLSPDGRWLAYASNESGRSEIYVEPVGGPGGRWQLSTEGGEQPRWGRTGHEIFYRNGTRMMSVPVETQPTFRAGKVAQLFDVEFDRGGAVGGYDASPDGKEFAVTRSERAAPTEIRVVVGWPEGARAGAR